MHLEFHDIPTADHPDLAELHALLERVFRDPGLTMPLPALARFVRSRAGPDMVPHCLVLRWNGRVRGGSVFRYIPAANTAFSGYLALEPDCRGRGWGRLLTAERMRILAADAAAHGRPGPDALFIDVADPDRMNTSQYAREREEIMDPRERRACMAHLGFRRVMLDFRPVPWAPGEHQSDCLDLLCLPIHPAWAARGAVPGDAVVATLTPIWQRINPAEAEEYLACLRQQAGGRWIPLGGK